MKTSVLFWALFLSFISLKVNATSCDHLLTDDIAPEYARVKEIASKDLIFSDDLVLKPDHIFLRTSTLHNILLLFEAITDNADYYFVGSGYHIPYLFAKAMFDGTAMEPRIKFLAISRVLAKHAVEQPQEFIPYFDSLGMHKNPQRRIVIIDSMTTSTPIDNDRSILRLSNAVRKYLMLKGYSSTDALHKVITLAMPERRYRHRDRNTGEVIRRRFRNLGGAPDLKSYDEKLAQINKDSLGLITSPFIDLGLSWQRLQPFKKSYMEPTHFSWLSGGKYNQLNEDGLPTTQDEINLSDREQKLNEYVAILNFVNQPASRRAIAPQVKRLAHRLGP